MSDLTLEQVNEKLDKVLDLLQRLTRSQVDVPVTIGEACRLAGISRYALFKAYDEGKLKISYPHRLNGQDPKISPDDLETIKEYVRNKYRPKQI